MIIKTLKLCANVSPKQVWLVWLLAILMSIGVYSLTLTLTKHIWQDEVQILELGRVLVPGADQSHSMYWNLEAQQPGKPLNYLGPLFQEAFYRLCAAGAVGARLSSLLGAICASAALLGWLMSRGICRWVALLSSLLFLWDPLFVEGYRGARVDSWAMAFMLLALWVVSEGKRQPLARPGFARWEIFAAICVALAGAFWISAILLVPLLIYEVLRSASEQPKTPLGIRLASLVWLGFFSVAAFVMLLLPVAPLVGFMISGTLTAAEHGAGSEIRLGEFLNPYLRSPWVPILAIASLFYARQWPLALALVIAVAGVFITSPYVHRNVYLLPYMILAVAVGVNKMWIAGLARSSAFAPATVLVLLAMITWSAGLSLGARTLVALKEAEFRNPDSLEVMLRSNFPYGPVKAYLIPYELYYAARSLQWKSYKRVLREDWSQLAEQQLLSQVDIVIQRADDTKGPTEAMMRSLGFVPDKISTGSGPARKFENYGEYIVYKRKASTN